MNLPTTISRQSLAKLALPDESHAVRVILKKVANNAPYLVRGKARRYLFERNPDAKAHCLDIPVSLWMQDVNVFHGYRPGTSIPVDLKPTITLPFMIHVVPWKGAASPAPAAQGSALAQIRRLLAGFNPPPAVLAALDLADAGQVDALEAHVDKVLDLRANATPEETPAQAKARKMREAKAAKKAAQPQLQPA
jgi:hypothetical protein